MSHFRHLFPLTLMAVAVPFAAHARSMATEKPPTASSARDSAQRGINYLSRATAEWSSTNKCYGCHVQAVTMEALSVGKHHQYTVPAADFSVIKNSLLNHDGGARGPNGLWHSSFPRTARTFGGAALARYDRYVDGEMTDDLFRISRQLLEYQQKDGSVTGDHQSAPVTTGVMQATYQAMQTWRQAYARSADNVWLAPIQRAERWMQDTSARWDALDGSVYLQDINYALLGLTAAGVSRSEETASRIIRHLVSHQNADGGWGFNKGSSDAYATGQTVHALRMGGMGEQDRSVARGIQWLVQHQQRDGGWGGGGSGKAEAMWAVLGMVSVDVMTVAVQGIDDGSKVRGVHEIMVNTKDNQGGKTKKVTIYVDDVKVQEGTEGVLKWTWDTKGLTTGSHIVDAVATNDRGQTSRRRIMVYAGDVFITQLGTRSEPGATQFTFRNLGRPEDAGSIRVRIHQVGKAATGETLVHEQTLPSAPGAGAASWSGMNRSGTAQPSGSYRVEVAFLNAKGISLQKEESVFWHGSEEQMNQERAQVRGRLSLPGAAAAPAANTRVELVDDLGAVVQSTVTTEEGEYRFKNVEDGKYKVRVRKDGFKGEDAPVNAKKAEESKASISLH